MPALSPVRARPDEDDPTRMTMAANVERVPELARRQAAIESLARELNAEPEHVRELFEQELAELEVNAKVRGYLHVLASRNVREALQATDHDDGAHLAATAAATPALIRARSAGGRPSRPRRGDR
jgi:hypothetical protein